MDMYRGGIYGHIDKAWMSSPCPYPRSTVGTLKSNRQKKIYSFNYSFIHPSILFMSLIYVKMSVCACFRSDGPASVLSLGDATCSLSLSFSHCCSAHAPDKETAPQTLELPLLFTFRLR